MGPIEKVAVGILASLVIYGPDGRHEPFEIRDANVRRLARSSLALILREDLVPSKGSFQLKGENFGTEQKLCESERFRQQRSVAFCSGSLIGPDLVLTAGHCIVRKSDCEKTRFVFDFAYGAAGESLEAIPASKVYSCRDIVYRVHKKEPGPDFALIRLDRRVPDRAPLPIRSSGDIKEEQEILAIGHPGGLPQKVTVGARVRSVSEHSFSTNLDTYSGNSGSPVFDADKGTIEGVLVDGEQDFKWDAQHRCRISRRCKEDSCRGEAVTKISEVLPFIPRFRP